MKAKGREGRAFSVLIRGCSFMMAYEVGVLAALLDQAPAMLKSASKIYGASSGAIIAAIALCECDLGEMKLNFYKFVENSFWSCVPGRRPLKTLREVLNKYLPPNAHQLVSGKLHVVVTRVRDCRSVLLSDFASKQDLIQAILCSCYIPLYFGLFPPVYHGVRYLDGEIGMWRANLVSQSTITISSFAGEYDICPKEDPAAFFTFQISDCILQLSQRNLCRLMHVFVLPSLEVLEQFYTEGYQDTASYLQRLRTFGINYLDEDFMLSMTKESCQKGAGTPCWKPETRLLGARATDSEDVTEKNPPDSR